MINPEMPLLKHIEELRWRLIKCALAVIVFAIPCGIYWVKIFDIVMIYPLRFANPKPQLIYTSPAETVVLSLKITIAGSLILASPVIFYQIWKFISPGLYKIEKMMVLPVSILSMLSFVTGILFCYFSLPLLLRFLTSFAPSRLNPFFRIDEYLSFLLKLSLAFGLIFELPVVSYILSRAGIISARFLIRNLRYAIVIIFIIAAILTPPDVVSQALLAAPLILLYAISIIVAWAAGRKKR